MVNYSSEQVRKFFEAISDWRGAYRTFRLSYLGVREQEKLLVLSARILMAVNVTKELVPQFNAGNIQCGQWEINPKEISVEKVIEGLTSPEGLNIPGHGTLLLPAYPDRGVSASTPILLHHEGIKNGNRVAVLTFTGSNAYPYLPQPETDWKLKAGTVPYDNLDELKSEYGLAGNPNADNAHLEVIALTAIEVLASSTIAGSTAKLGVWAAKELDVAKVQLGYRIFEKDKVVLRDAIKGNQLDWYPVGEDLGGSTELNVTPGSFIQCIASYNGLAHDIKWYGDPNFLPNSRAAVLTIVDPSRTLLQSFLCPEKPYKGKPQDDFEMAIGWLFWALGFASLNFGTNPKTKDAFDTVLVTPNGDFAVIECTLELLRTESKLSKLAARAAKLREVLDDLHQKHIRLLPIIISSMSREQVKADIDQAEKLGILVLTKEDIEWALTEITRFPNANKLYEEGIQTVQNRINQPDLFKQK